MPLVTSTGILYGDNGGNNWGPHYTAAGNVITFVRYYLDARYVRPQRSTDGGATWADRTPRNFGSNVNAFWSVLDASGDIIHVAAHLDTGEVVYVTYTASTDTWGTAETVHTNANGASDGFGVVIRQHPSTGRLWIFYQGDTETVFSLERLRCYLTERTAANTYTSPLSVAGDGENHYITVGDMLIDPAGLIHLFYGTWQPRTYYRTYNGSALSSEQEVTDAAAPFANNVAKRLARYEVGGSDRILFSWRGASGTPYASYSDAGGTPAAAVQASTDVAVVWDSDNAAAITLVADQQTAYLLYINDSDGDLYLVSSEDGGAWTSPTALVTGITGLSIGASVYINGSNEVVIGILYYESGTGVSFYEHVLRSLVAAPVTVPVSTGTIAATGGTATITNAAIGENVVVSVLPAVLESVGGTITPGGGASTVSVSAAAMGVAGRRIIPALELQAYSWSLWVDWNGDGSYESNEGFRLKGLRVRRGRQEPIGPNGSAFSPYRAGQCFAVLDNSDGRYDARNASSPLYPNILPARRCYIEVSFGAWTERVFTGVIKDLAPQGRQTTVELTIVEPPEIYANKVALPVQRQETVNNLFTLITAVAGASAVRIGTSLDILPFWWATSDSYIGCLRDIADVMQDDVFVDAYGRTQYLVHGWPNVETWTLQEDQILRNFELNQPWTYLRNRVQIQSAPRTIGSVTALWTLPDTPVLAQGDTFETTALFSDNTGVVPAVNVLTPVAGIDFIANTAADGSGTDVTNQFTVTMTTYGTKATIAVEYTGSGSPAYITLLQVRGQPISQSNLQQVERFNSTSISTYGEQVFALSNPLVQSYGYAMPLADQILTRLSSPKLSGIVRLESRGERVQFAAELGRKMTLDLSSMGINEDMKIGGISHEWLGETGQGVVTTFWLEPWVDYSSYWHFTTTLNSTSRLGG